MKFLKRGMLPPALKNPIKFRKNKRAMSAGFSHTAPVCHIFMTIVEILRQFF